MSRLATHSTLAAAIGTVLALVAIAAALNMAAAYPALNGRVTVLIIAMGVGVIALAITVSAAVLRRLCLPSSNDAWILW